MDVPFMYCMTVGATVVLERVVAVEFVAGWKPTIDVFQDLLMA